MVFCCFPPRSKCEWAHLRGFVAQYNRKNDKTYTRTACLDVGERQTKQPELLLEADGETPIVIEHKSIVWPPAHFSDHDNEHLLAQLVASSVGDLFRDSVYEFEFFEKSLKSKKKRQVEEFAEQIACILRSNETRARTQIGLSKSEPIPWKFHALSPMERDEAGWKTGIFTTVSSGTWSDGQSEILNGNDEETKAGYSEQLEIAAANASEKFDEYSHCLKFLLIQFHGDSSFTLDDEDMLEIVRSANLPEMIDQVWVAQQDWVSADDYELSWQHVH